MDYPHHSTYARLYARYLAPERTEQLLDLAGPLAGAKVLDLCGGGGRLARAAARRGARVMLLDQSAPMAAASDVQWYQSSVEDALVSFSGPFREVFDVVFCQQAINYWLTEKTARQLAFNMAPGSRFIFNTFNKQPPAVPLIKAYEYEGLHYVESSHLVGDTVHHVQICEGMAPHMTAFAWLSREDLTRWLAPYFTLTEHVEGATSVWVCVRAQD